MATKYNPYNYVPDFSWIRDVGSAVANTVAKMPEAIELDRALNEDRFTAGQIKSSFRRNLESYPEEFYNRINETKENVLNLYNQIDEQKMSAKGTTSAIYEFARPLLTKMSKAGLPLEDLKNFGVNYPGGLQAVEPYVDIAREKRSRELSGQAGEILRSEEDPEAARRRLQSMEGLTLEERQQMGRLIPTTLVTESGRQERFKETSKMREKRDEVSQRSRSIRDSISAGRLEISKAKEALKVHREDKKAIQEELNELDSMIELSVGQLSEVPANQKSVVAQRLRDYRVKRNDIQQTLDTINEDIENLVNTISADVDNKPPASSPGAVQSPEIQSNDLPLKNGRVVSESEWLSDFRRAKSIGAGNKSRAESYLKSLGYELP